MANLDNSISIVTAFYDLGRANWKGFERSVDYYFNNFARLAQLENEMVVYVASEEHKERVLALRGNRKTEVVIYDLFKEQADLVQRVKAVLENPEYKSKVKPELLENGNIEYFNAEYDVVNFAKTLFINHAIENNLVSHEQVAWVDFGYHRNKKFCKNISEWRFAFTPDKINFFNVIKAKRIPPFNTEEQIFRFMYENIVYIVGCIIVGNRKAWQEFNQLLYPIIDELLARNIIDDDQGVYMYCIHKKPELFKINYVGKRWRIQNIVNNYNDQTLRAKVFQFWQKIKG